MDEIFSFWEFDCPELVPSMELCQIALELAIEWVHPFHDCLYLATAIAMEGILVTADRRLGEVAQGNVSEVVVLGLTE